MKGVVYKITNLVNWKVYVGKTVSPSIRWGLHFRDAKKLDTYFSRAIRKYGNCVFVFSVLEIADSKILNEREKHWIAKLNTCHGVGYNSTEGGEGGAVIDPISRMRLSHPGKLNPFYGKRHTEEVKMSISLKNRGKGKVLTKEIVLEMMEEYQQGKSQRKIARERGYAKSTVNEALSGRNWRHLR